MLWIHKVFHPIGLPLIECHFGKKQKLKNKLMCWCITWKMKPNTFEYACKMILPIKKDGSFHFYRY